MANVLLTWELGAGVGHCTKLAVLAERLVERGHEVWIAVRELPTVQGVLRSKKVRFLQAPFLTKRPVNPIAQTRSLAHILHNNGFGDFDALRVLCAAWRNIFSAARPDILVCDHAPIALLASHEYTMRRVLVGTGFTVPPNISPFPQLRYWDTVTEDDDLRQDEEVICNRINELSGPGDAKRFDTLAQLYASADERFLLTFRELDHYPTREGARYWGAWSLAGGAAPEWPVGEHRIFAYLKPPAANWPLAEFLSYLRESRLPAIAFIAGSDPRTFAKYQSAQLRIADKYLNIADVARHCDLAILHGTSGSATAFLLAGVPQLHMPLFLEQLILSRRVADLGAGLFVNPARPREAVSRLVEMLQVDRFRFAAREFSRRYAEFDPQRAADDIVARIRELLSN